MIKDPEMQRRALGTTPREYYGRLKKEYAACALCGSRKKQQLYIGDRYGMGLRTVYCKRCGLIFTDPRPVQAEMEEFYNSHYRFFYEAVAAPSQDYIDKGIFSQRAAKVYDILDQAIDLGRVAAVLDVGCSEGSFLRHFGQRHPGARRVGIEPSPAFSAFAGKYASADIFTGGLEAFIDARPTDRGAFDVVVLCHVLEHFLNPGVELDRIRDLLADGGHLYAEVPNATSPVSKLGMLHIAHVFHFSADTFTLFLQKHGFEPMILVDQGLADAFAMSIVAKKVRPRQVRLPSADQIARTMETVLAKLPPPASRPRLGRAWSRLKRRICEHVLNRRGGGRSDTGEFE